MNRNFADVLLEEMKASRIRSCWCRTITLRLLPQNDQEEAVPTLAYVIFWHIPWPNPEAFGICPWQKELLDGMLGADLIGFHIQAHCNNFLETVDRALESRIDWEHLRRQSRRSPNRCAAISDQRCF